MSEITPNELRLWLAQQKDIVLVDVRESFEREAYNIGGIHIPVNDVMERKEELRHDIPVVLYCEKGIRSGIILQRLEQAGFKNLYNLSGGMYAWKKATH